MGSFNRQRHESPHWWVAVLGWEGPYAVQPQVPCGSPTLATLCWQALRLEQALQTGPLTLCPLPSLVLHCCTIVLHPVPLFPPAVPAGLYDMVMIKDNHIAAAGGIEAAVRGAEVGLVGFRRSGGICWWLHWDGQLWDA